MDSKNPNPPGGPAQGPVPALDKWRKLSLLLIVLGGVLGLIGLIRDPKQFGYSYLLAFIFFLSLCLGGMFLTIIHHLFDAQWSVPIRRVTEHLAFLLPVMFFLFLPIAALAPTIYTWFNISPSSDHALLAKQPIFSKPWFYFIYILLFALWTFLSFKLRYWSLRQDETGAPECTYKMRQFSAWGIYAFAFSLTLGAIMWIKSLEWQWFSTMYGVYYFAASVWTTLATVYVIALALQRTGPLKQVMRSQHFKDLGTLFLAFTVFYAYIHFSQYFLIWNAAIPEETFWYVQREQGSWWDIGMILIFGHFFLPFLALLRIDAKLALPLMIPLCAWAWLMHFCDMAFNIMPVLHPEGFHPHYLDVACFAFIGGVLGLVFLKYFRSHAPYPVKDPRLGESLGLPQISSTFKSAAAK
jgi:hypothetical protein